MFGIIEFNPRIVDANDRVTSPSFPIAVGRVDETARYNVLNAVLGINLEQASPVLRPVHFTKKGAWSRADVNSSVNDNSFLTAIISALRGAAPTRWACVTSWSEHLSLRMFKTRQELSQYLKGHHIQFAMADERPAVSNTPPKVELPSGDYSLAELYQKATISALRHPSGQQESVIFSIGVTKETPKATITDQELAGVAGAMISLLPSYAAQCLILRDNGRIDDNYKRVVAAAFGPKTKIKPIKLGVVVQ